MKALKALFIRNLPGLTTVVMILAFLTIYFAPNSVITIPAGYVGVLWKRFDDGTLTDAFYREGNRFVLPWNKIVKYDARMQRVTETYDIISANGLTIGADITVRYRIDREGVGLLHKYLGPDYLATILIPKIGAIARAEAAKYSPVQIYSTNREDVEEAILVLTRSQMEKVTSDVVATERAQRRTEGMRDLTVVPDTLIELHDVMFRSIALPALVRDAIERKEEQYHVNLEYDFRIDRERKESERKAIEARGIQEFQRIVNDGITDAYLRWKGIDATLQLALSNNSKIVVIGSGQDGLPIILGPVDGGRGSVPGQPAIDVDLRTSPTSGPPAAPNQTIERAPGVYSNGTATDLGLNRADTVLPGLRGSAETEGAGRRSDSPGDSRRGLVSAE